ncbi:hypothetical protein MTO96_036496 [Rhipicephalus appendiculatus]
MFGHLVGVPARATTALAGVAGAKTHDVDDRRFRETASSNKFRNDAMSEYCLQPCSTNKNIMFVRREPIADDVFSPVSSPKRLCLDTESRNSCDVDAIARIMTPTPPSESPRETAPPGRHPSL